MWTALNAVGSFASVFLNPMVIINSLFTVTIHGIAWVLGYFASSYAMSPTMIINFFGYFPNSYFELLGVTLAICITISGGLLVFKLVGNASKSFLSPDENENTGLTMYKTFMSVLIMPIFYTLGFSIFGVLFISTIVHFVASIDLGSIVKLKTVTSGNFMQSLALLGGGQGTASGLVISGSLSAFTVIVAIVIIIALFISGIRFVFKYIQETVIFWLFGWTSPLIFFSSAFTGEFSKNFLQRMFLIGLEQVLRLLVILMLKKLPFDALSAILEICLLQIGINPLQNFGISSTSDSSVFASLGIVMNSATNMFMSGKNLIGNLSSKPVPTPPTPPTPKQ